MKNKKYRRKRAACIILTAAIFMTGGFIENCLAEEAISTEIKDSLLIPEKIEQTEILEKDTLEEKQESELEDHKLEQTIEIISNGAIEAVSNGAIKAVSGSGLQVMSLTAKVSTKDYLTTEKHLKLNFSYKILGCAKVDSHLNVRKEPNTDSEIVGKLSNNTFCNVQEVYNNGWAKIKSGKVKGYVLIEYLLIGEKAEKQAEKKAKKMVKAKTSRLNVRSLPSTKTRVYTQLRKNAKANVKYEKVTKARIKNLWKRNKSLRRQVSKRGKKKILKASNLEDWICIKYKGKTAFVSKEYVKLVYTVKTASEENKKQDSLRAKIVKYAKKFVGNRYVYGGSSLKHGTDCSGFVMRVYQHFGYHLSRSSAAQSHNGKKIKRSQLKPGDLLFYKKGGRIGHVSMYIGNGKVVHASNKRNGIMISKIGYRKACRYVSIV